MYMHQNMQIYFKQIISIIPVVHNPARDETWWFLPLVFSVIKAKGIIWLDTGWRIQESFHCGMLASALYQYYMFDYRIMQRQCK